MIPSPACSPTSADAADRFASREPSVKARVLEVFEARGAIGATDDELYRELPEERPDIVRARRCRLRDDGVIVATEARRETRAGCEASVWVLKGCVGQMELPI